MIPVALKIFLYLADAAPSPSFYNLILTVSTGCVNEPAQTDAAPASIILRNAYSSYGPGEFIYYLSISNHHSYVSDIK